MYLYIECVQGCTICIANVTIGEIYFAVYNKTTVLV
jgi:hypothetical protein